MAFLIGIPIGIATAIFSMTILGPNRRGEAFFLSMFFNICIITALTLLGVLR